MKFNSKMDVFSAQIIANYLKEKSDFLNFIQIKKQYQFILDRFRINPIPITNETKNLFQCLDTQQIFKKDSDEIVITNKKIIQYNYEVTYSEMLEMKNENESKNEQLEDDEKILLKFKKVIWTEKDLKEHGNRIPKDVTIIGSYLFSFRDMFQDFLLLHHV